MNRNLFGIQVLSSQIQAANPFLILVFIPLCSYVIYPAIDKFFKLTPLRKMGLGLFLMASSFIIPTWCETRITAGESPTFLWQVLAYVILTLSEVMVSITALEFSYTQAPKTMKSLVVSLYLLGVSGGNFFAAAVNKFIQNPDGSVKLEGASYYAFFMIVMFVCAVIFIPVAMLYRGKTYIQGDDENVKKMEKAEAEGRS
jgi:POT family proton-dependent oligopeptide transporter